MRFILTTAAAIAMASAANAADLGGNCCADLEERVAELEAEAVRKGNRKVSLTVSGQVHEAIVFFDADEEKNAYVGTNNVSRSRFSFKGSANINTDWSAGFLMELGVRANDLQDTSQETGFSGQKLDIRHEALYLSSKSYGTVWLGWTSSATDGITEICIGCGLGNTPELDAGMPGLLTKSGATYGDVAGEFAGEGDRLNIVKYVSPTFAGFSISASAGGDDYWDAAIRYAAEVGNVFRIAAGAGYAVDSDGYSASFGYACSDGVTASECSNIGTSASIQHIPTGLYLSGSYGILTDENASGDQDENTSWFLTGGIERKFIAAGNTNVWAMYTETERKIGLASGQNVLTQYGAGIEQKIDAAAMDIYLNYKRQEAEEEGFEDSQADVVTTGARIKF